MDKKLPEWVKTAADYESWKSGRGERTDGNTNRGIDDLPALKFDPQVLGLIGAGMTGLGVFLPFVKLPIFGSINYFGSGERIGVFLFLCSIISVILIFSKLLKFIYIPATLSALPLTYSIYKVKYGLDSIEAPAVEKSNPFSGLAAGMVEAMRASIQIEFGAYLIFFGISCQLVSYLIYKNRARAMFGEENKGI